MQRMLIVALAFGCGSAAPREVAPRPASHRTQLVMLGTGNPVPDPERAGPATAVVVDDVAYVFDCGPGVVRRASAAAKKHGLAALQFQVDSIDCSDHSILPLPEAALPEMLL